VVSTLVDAYISKDVNTYIMNTDNLVNAHSVPREWYMDQSIFHAGASDNDYGFYWSTEYGGSRDEAQGMRFYVGYPWDYHLDWVDYNTYVTAAVTTGFANAVFLLSDFYDLYQIGKGTWAKITDNKKVLKTLNYGNLLSDKALEIVTDPVEKIAYSVWMVTHSPVYAYQNVSIPGNADYLQVEYSVAAADDDSYLAVLLDDQIAYYQPLHDLVGRTVTSPLIFLGDYAGTDKAVTVLVDNPDNAGDGAQVAFRDLSFGQLYSHDVYSFKYTCNNGNYLTGTVLADSLHGYAPGDTWTQAEGTYEISGVSPGEGELAKEGQVFIASYHDADNGLDYTPLEYTQGLPSGTNYLGSEEFRGGIAQVTDNNGYFDVAPQVMDDGKILWQGWDGHDYEIYCLVPGQGVIQLTNNNSPDVMPQMNASGQAVWMNWDGQDWEVWYNLGNGPVQLTNNSGAFDVMPQITADAKIYWQGWDGHDYEIYRYYEIYLNNTTLRVTDQLTNNNLPDVAPQVNASGEFTWMGFDGSNWQIYYNAGSGPVQVTTSGSNLAPQITDDGQIFWQGRDSGNFEICRFTIGSGVTDQLTDNTVDHISPSAKNGVLVWAQWDGYYWQVYREVLSTGLITQITSDSYDNKNPRVNASGQIVWQKWDGSDYEVYAYE
jgi:hypothetical protein